MDAMKLKRQPPPLGKKRLQDRLKENKRALHDGEEILCKQCFGPITNRHWNSIYCIECRPSRPKSPVENNGHAILKRTVNCNLCLSAHDYTSDAARSVCDDCNEKKLNQSKLFFPWKTVKLGENYADVIHPESGPLSVVVSTQITGCSWRVYGFMGVQVMESGEVRSEIDTMINAEETLRSLLIGKVKR